MERLVAEIPADEKARFYSFILPSQASRTIRLLVRRVIELGDEHGVAKTAIAIAQERLRLVIVDKDEMCEVETEDGN